MELAQIIQVQSLYFKSNCAIKYSLIMRVKSIIFPGPRTRQPVHIGGGGGIISIIGSGKYDSVRLGNVAAGLAEKIEEDRGRRSGTVTVWSVDENNFPGFPGEGGEKLSGESRKYLSGLSDLSGADLLFFVSRLRFLPYSVQVNSAYSQYDGNNVTLPFEVDFNIYDTEQELLL